MVEDVHEIRVEGVDRVFVCREGQSVLAALSPIHRLSIDSGCRGGGCGVCKVEILEGQCEMGPMSAAHVTEEDRARGVGLSCRMVPTSNLTLRVKRAKAWKPYQWTGRTG